MTNMLSPRPILGKNFINAPWLFAEAYKYRRLHECFSISKYWKDYDVFFRQKVPVDNLGRFEFVIKNVVSV